MVDRTRWCPFLVATLSLFLVLPPAAAELGPTPEFTARGTSASAAVKGLTALFNWISDAALSYNINRGVAEQDKTVREYLATTGQQGVLLEIAIVKVEGETTVYRLLDNGVFVLGAGTSPANVWLASVQQPQLRPTPGSGKLDNSRSFFLWFFLDKDGKSIKVTSYAKGPIQYEAAQALSNKALLGTLNRRAFDESIRAAVDFVERTTQDKQLGRRISEIRRQQAENDRKIAEIEEKLADEQEKIRKAQAIYDRWSMIATVLTFANQLATVKAQLGKDAPPELDKAKTSDDIFNIMRRMIMEEPEKLRDLQIVVTPLYDNRRRQSGDYLGVLRGHGKPYPSERVPEMSLPLPPLR